MRKSEKYEYWEGIRKEEERGKWKKVGKRWRKKENDMKSDTFNHKSATN